jgi:hypothetical protein
MHAIVVSTVVETALVQRRDMVFMYVYWSVQRLKLNKFSLIRIMKNSTRIGGRNLFVSFSMEVDGIVRRSTRAAYCGSMTVYCDASTTRSDQQPSIVGWLNGGQRAAVRAAGGQEVKFRTNGRAAFGQRVLSADQSASYGYLIGSRV